MEHTGCAMGHTFQTHHPGYCDETHTLPSLSAKLQLLMLLENSSHRGDTHKDTEDVLGRAHTC